MSQNDKAALPADAAAPAKQERPWRPGLVLVLVLGVYYGLLQNGQWVPISDGDFYIAVARNLLLGQGYVFNGMPAKVSPPGYPMFLAGAMHVSPSFWFLGIVEALLMLGALLLFYRVLLRRTTPRRALVVCLVAGMLSPTFRGVFLMHTEPLFCVLAAGAILLAIQMNEGRRARWRLPALLALCVTATTVRLAGLLMVPVIAGALLSGHLRPAWNKLWVGAALVTVLTGATFLAMRYTPAPSPKQPAAQEGGQAAIVTYPATQHPILSKLHGFAGRLPQAGVWFCELVAEPTHLERTFRLVSIAANLVGWVLFGLIIAGTVPFLLRCQWIVPGALLYCLALIGIWGTVVARYLVPVAPLLLLALLDGVDLLGRARPSPPWRKLSRVVIVGLFVGMAVCNLSLYAVDVWKLHSRDFYSSYFAGQAKPLISIADYLKSQHVRDCDVATTRIKLDWEGVSPSMGFLFEVRGLSLLLNKTLLLAPQAMSMAEPGPDLARWLQENGAKYYVYRPPVNPWRLWQFRVPWLQEWVTGEPVGKTNPFFMLYEVKDGRLEGVTVPPWDGRIERVPML